MSDTTDPAIADIATQSKALPLHSLQLIGIAGTQDARRALLRSAAGDIQTVRVGDTLHQGTVVAIGEDAVILSNRKGTETLRLPAPARSRVAA